MRILEERSVLVTHAGMDVLHAELTLRDKAGQRFFAQAHDNGSNRYYALTRQSWFILRESGEEEEDPVEEYSTSGNTDAPLDEAEPDFAALLREHKRNEACYEDSEYADFFVKADRLLDDLAEEEIEED